MKEFTPRPYQTMIVDHIHQVPRCAVWAGMGLGKTISTYSALDGLFDGGSVDGTPWHPADFTETCKESIEQGDIFVGNNQHGRLLRRIGSVGVEAGGEPACIVHPGYEGLHISCGEGA